MARFVFVAHDPGAKNHLMPLHSHAAGQGYPSRFVDLAGAPYAASEIATALGKQPIPLLVCGCSENQEEWPWVRAARRAGVSSAVVVDVGIGVGLTGIQIEDFPDRFLVTNDSCADELRQRGCPSQRIRVIGSPHLEALSAMRELKAASRDVKRGYGIDAERPLVSFFLSSCDTEAGVIPCFHALLTESCLRDWVLIIRPHPRNSPRQVSVVQEDCKGLPDVILDTKGSVETPTLLASSIMSFSMVSTVSAESLILKTPSAFFQIGWNYSGLEYLYRNLDPIPRVRTAAQFQRFVSRVVGGEVHAWPSTVERHLGATLRGWQALHELTEL